MTRIPRLPLALAAALLCAAHPAAAQEITGWVVDEASGQPVAGASVVLIDASDQAKAGAITTAEGRFWIKVGAADRYRLRASRVGYRTAMSGAMTVAPKDTLVVELRLSTQAVVLAPVTVISTSAPVTRDPRMAGFESRRRNGWGRFMGPDEIERLHPFHVSEVLQHVGHVRIKQNGSGFQRVAVMRSPSGEDCTPFVFVDGVRSRAAEEDGVDGILTGTSVMAVEVYTTFTTPAEFYVPRLDRDCGVIAIWTKRT
ncbi:MAG TPA: TonB-dependent receptor [Longimicrobium sp.]|nr:TonB-dependent receptor [Longimicrobium sp.]